MSRLQAQATPAGRSPRQVQTGLWLFAPSRESQGGSAWWLEPASGHGAGVLIDCPAFNEANLAFLQARPAGRIVLTGREGHGRLRRFQEALGWPVHVQEQEAYLLPGVQQLIHFSAESELEAGLRLLWTPGPSPGSAVLLAAEEQERPSLLFCGRLLSPVAPGCAAPLRTRRSFHWGRWLRSLERLRVWLPPDQPDWLASGAGLGALRGEALVPSARRLIDQINLQALEAEEAV
ncbi:MBL fold metallo-hydrolase [Synechococcus sp. LA31]|uniref:MBL fold metallo-hydrolase n=1 Tax=Synechococcus sp. LA31 TaxID=2741953 RepID=UPI001BDC2AC9|nr:MBL fold metallo-hydrolase [Synechococcus sp. LA31]QVV67481.1 MBL fold metallo-hydrolase [Synechococcus sp. LA31]